MTCRNAQATEWILNCKRIELKEERDQAEIGCWYWNYLVRASQNV